MDKVYICYTYYHIYVTLAKEINNNEKIDIILSTSIPEVDKISKKLKESKVFKNTYIFPELEIKEEFQKEKIESKIFRKDSLIKLVEKYFKNFKEYKDIYIYNDWSMFGCYLIDKKISYHLIEDGIDAFYYFDINLPFFYNKFFRPNIIEKFKKTLKKILNCGYDFYGTSKYVIDIEVNDISKIKVPLSKMIEKPKKDIFDSLKKEDQKRIYNILNTDNLNFKSKSKKLLLLTQPLFIDKMINTMDGQIKTYKSILTKYGKDYEIYIKPHPRDTVDYAKEYKEFNLKIISKNMPMEILNYNEEAIFDLGITITSSSIKGVKNIKKKIELGMEYLKDFE